MPTGDRKSSVAPVLFWSGGKDSFLAFDSVRGEAPVLLTTYDPATGQVPHQNIPIAHVRAQAKVLGRPLCHQAEKLSASSGARKSASGRCPNSLRS